MKRLKRLKLSLTLITIILPIGMTFGQDTVDCFLKNSELKIAKIPQYMTFPAETGQHSTIIQIDYNDTIRKVSKYLYGLNANVYSGSYNEATTLKSYLKILKPNIIRYPGGLHSNEYFWNASYNWGTSSYVNLPSDIPAKLTNSSGAEYNPFWVPGGGYWTFALDDFYSFAQEIGAEPLMTVNYSYARYGTGPTPVQTAAHLAAEWVRYDNGRTKYWEIGNENMYSWSSGYRINTSLNQDDQPQTITPELYGEHFKIFADSMRKAASDIAHTIYIGAQNDVGVLSTAGSSPDWMLDHTYFTPYQENSGVSTILNSVIPEVKKFYDKTNQETSKYTTGYKPITLTEWNIFAEGSGQASSFINGIHATMVLGEMASYGYGLGNRWDIAQSNWGDGDDFGLFSSGDDPDGASYKWNPRAPFYYMHYFQKMFGDHVISSKVIGSTNIVAYASKFNSGEIGIVIVNKSSDNQIVKLDVSNFEFGERFYFYELLGGTDNGSFSYKVYVNYAEPTAQIGGPAAELETIKAYSPLIEGGIKLKLYSKAVTYVLIPEPSEPSANNFTSRNEISVFPNPGNGNFNVSVPEGANWLEIIDMNGRTLKKYQLKDYEKNVFSPSTSLSSGAYIIKVATSKTIYSSVLFVK